MSTPLPPGWGVASDPSTGKPYYYNHGTGETSWTRPAPSKPTRQPPTAPGASGHYGGGAAAGLSSQMSSLSVSPAPAPAASPAGGTWGARAAASAAQYSPAATQQQQQQQQQQSRYAHASSAAAAATRSPAAPAPAAAAAPNGLPEGWQSVVDPRTRDTYYHNMVTNETTWTRPAAPATNPRSTPARPPAAAQPSPGYGGHSGGGAGAAVAASPASAAASAALSGAGMGGGAAAVAAKPRREVIMAESNDPVGDGAFQPRTYPKSAEAARSITAALRAHFLFAELEASEIAMVVASMFEQRINTGDVIIRQGDKGDNFYTVQSGSFDITVNGQKVAFAAAGSCFGELALLYNCPRAASVIACGPASVWALDRLSFRHILAHASASGKSEIKKSLRGVEMLRSLTDAQVTRLADVVQVTEFAAGQTIIHKGERGHVFYIIKSGKVVCTEVGNGVRQLEDVHLSTGEYFGERALLMDEPRAANVIAEVATSCYVLDRSAFDDLLGPLHEVMGRNVSTRVLLSVPILKTLADHEREAVVDACETVTFANGERIITQGEPGDTFYIVQEGACSVTQAATPGAAAVEVAVLATGDYFGEMALLNDDVRQATVTAKGAAGAKCFCINRANFERVLGPLKQLMRRSMRERGLSSPAAAPAGPAIRFEDLEILRTLGTGTFGRVRLVKHKQTQQVYAFKILQKARIVAFQQQKNTMNEKNILASSQHPFILDLVATFKDQDCLYMLLEVVMGGELFTHMQSYPRCAAPASTARFFAGCVLSALDYLHRKHVLYRDLKVRPPARACPARPLRAFRLTAPLLPLLPPRACHPAAAAREPAHRPGGLHPCRGLRLRQGGAGSHVHRLRHARIPGARARCGQGLQQERGHLGAGRAHLRDAHRPLALLRPEGRRRPDLHLPQHYAREPQVPGERV